MNFPRRLVFWATEGTEVNSFELWVSAGRLFLFSWLAGVWVTDYASMTGLAHALRLSLINAAKEKTLSANQDTVKDVIYRYVTGQEFAMQIRAVAGALGRMKEDLDKEKRAMEKIWKSKLKLF